MKKLKAMPIPENPAIETWTVAVTLADGKTETINQVIQFGPIPNTDLLSVTVMGGQSTVYPMRGNVRKYTFRRA